MTSKYEEIDKKSGSSDNLKKILNNIENDYTNNYKRSIWFVCSCCGKKVTDSYLYKCLYCPNYDICSKCFENKKTKNPHINGHPMMRFSERNEWCGKDYDSLRRLKLDKLVKDFKDEIHDEHSCNVCKSDFIKGLRFKCESCMDYDMCFECFKSKHIQSDSNHKLDHNIIVIGKTNSLKLNLEQINCEGLLGKGAFGEVYKAQLSDTTVACKIIHYDTKKEKSKLLLKTFQRELEAYTEIKGENVLKFIGHCHNVISENQTDFYLITEFMEKGSLADLLENEKDMSHNRRLGIAHDIASGMSRIHDLGFIHRDIRPDNILITKSNVAKIGDMGIAKLIDKYNDQTLIGHPKYMPPEFYTRNYTKKLDVYTFGLTLVELYDGSHGRKRGYIKVKNKPQKFSELVELCIDNDQNNRPSSKEIETYLSILKQAMLEYIKGNTFYMKWKTGEKNKKFDAFYKIIHEQYYDRVLNNHPTQTIKLQQKTQNLYFTSPNTTEQVKNCSTRRIKLSHMEEKQLRNYIGKFNTIPTLPNATLNAASKPKKKTKNCSCSIL